MSGCLGSFVHPNWIRGVAVGAHRILFYADGTVRFSHRCDRGDRGVIICDPLLQMGNGHRIVTDDPLTIEASILCPDCGTHGWVRGGEWVEA